MMNELLSLLRSSEAIALAMLSVALLLCFYRLVRGPSIPDRVIALDLLAIVAVGIIGVIAVETDLSVYLDNATVVAIIAFLGTVAFAYFLERGVSR